MIKNVVLFASGNGSNVQRIAEYFSSHSMVHIKKIYCNRPDAFVLQRAIQLNIQTFVFNKQQLNNNNEVLEQLLLDAPDLIVLAGFLWLMPKEIIRSFPEKIINIHPALLPSYGGKGMYGSKVHQAIIKSGEKESGITIHYVNEIYDEGKPIFQTRCPVYEDDTIKSLAQRIHRLEYKHFPKVIESILF